MIPVLLVYWFTQSPPNMNVVYIFLNLNKNNNIYLFDYYLVFYLSCCFFFKSYPPFWTFIYWLGIVGDMNSNDRIVFAWKLALKCSTSLILVRVAQSWPFTLFCVLLLVCLFLKVDQTISLFKSDTKIKMKNVENIKTLESKTQNRNLRLTI